VRRAGASQYAPQEVLTPFAAHAHQDFLRIRRTSKLLILVQLFRRKFACEFAANGVRTSGGLYWGVTAGSSGNKMSKHLERLDFEIEEDATEAGSAFVEIGV
jgi:hypothetical protein